MGEPRTTTPRSLSWLIGPPDIVAEFGNARWRRSWHRGYGAGLAEIRRYAAVRHDLPNGLSSAVRARPGLVTTYKSAKKATRLS